MIAMKINQPFVFKSEWSELFKQTAGARHGAHMLLSLIEMQFLGDLFQAYQCDYHPLAQGLEVGTFVGQTSFYLSKRFPQVFWYTLESNVEVAKVARENWEGLAQPSNLKIVVHSAQTFLNENLGVHPDLKTLGFVFIDANKGGYWDYYQTLTTRLPGPYLLVFDNVFLNGQLKEWACSLVPELQQDPTYLIQMFPSFQDSSGLGTLVDTGIASSGEIQARGQMAPRWSTKVLHNMQTLIKKGAETPDFFLSSKGDGMALFLKRH